MRSLNRWHYLLFLMVCVGIGVGWLVASYFRSPGYRAAQAYGRIHEGMSRDEAHRILSAHGGEPIAVVLSGLLLSNAECYASYSFGEHDHIHLEFQSDDGTQYIENVHLTQRSFNDWLATCIESVQSSTTAEQSDANQRMEELLNKYSKEISEQNKRFRELDQPQTSPMPKE